MGDGFEDVGGGGGGLGRRRRSFIDFAEKWVSWELCLLWPDRASVGMNRPDYY